MQNYDAMSEYELASVAGLDKAEPVKWLCVSCIGDDTEFSVGFRKVDTCDKCGKKRIVHRILNFT